jgi:type VI secretion system protein VasG
MGRIKKRVEANHRIPFNYGEDAVALIVKRCNNAEAGGRIIDSILTNTVLPRVSIEYLTRMSQGVELNAISLGAADGEFTYVFD